MNLGFAASFDIFDGKVAACREYVGDIDPALVDALTGETKADIVPGAANHS